MELAKKKRNMSPKYFGFLCNRSDTIVVLDGKILGNRRIPRSGKDAPNLERRTHHVYTGVAISVRNACDVLTKRRWCLGVDRRGN